MARVARRDPRKRLHRAGDGAMARRRPLEAVGVASPEQGRHVAARENRPSPAAGSASSISVRLVPLLGPHASDVCVRARRLKRKLILQRRFWNAAGEATFVVAAAGLGLASAAPARPVQPELALLGGEEQHGQQTPHLRGGERD